MGRKDRGVDSAACRSPAVRGQAKGRRAAGDQNLKLEAPHGIDSSQTPRWRKPPRRERLWGTTPGKHRRLGPGPVSGFAFCVAVSDWQRPEEPFAGADPGFESASLRQRVRLSGGRCRPKSRSVGGSGTRGRACRNVHPLALAGSEKSLLSIWLTRRPQRSRTRRRLVR